ncbi:MAG: 50S ribosomal protein L20 [Deltaproteobacteria bacterium]|nr:50S ribosomal protein L20 [Deltaproteobacteria bacterium]
MPRVKRSVNAKKNRRNVLKVAKGMRSARSRLYRIAIEAVDRALVYGYRDRRNKKRVMRRLWVARINALARVNDITYSRLIDGLKKANIELDRKSLSELAVRDPDGFARVASMAKAALSA